MMFAIRGILSGLESITDTSGVVYGLTNLLYMLGERFGYGALKEAMGNLGKTMGEKVAVPMPAPPRLTSNSSLSILDRLVLLSFPELKISVIKEVRMRTGFDLRASKELTETVIPYGSKQTEPLLSQQDLDAMRQAGLKSIADKYEVRYLDRKAAVQNLYTMAAQL